MRACLSALSGVTARLLPQGTHSAARVEFVELVLFSACFRCWHLRCSDRMHMFKHGGPEVVCSFRSPLLLAECQKCSLDGRQAAIASKPSAESQRQCAGHEDVDRPLVAAKPAPADMSASTSIYVSSSGAPHRRKRQPIPPASAPPPTQPSTQPARPTAGHHS